MQNATVRIVGALLTTHRNDHVDSADVSSGVAPMDSADELAAEPLGAELLRF